MCSEALYRYASSNKPNVLDCLQVQECMDALAAGKEWQPARADRLELLEDGDGAESQVLCSTAPFECREGLTKLHRRLVVMSWLHISGAGCSSTLF